MGLSISDNVLGFVSNLWRVHYPVTETNETAKQGVESDNVKLDKEAVDPDLDASNPDAKQMGVYLAEASYATTGKSFYILLAFLMLGSFVNLLDNQVTTTLTNSVAQSVFKSTTGATAQAVQQVIQAVSKPFIGKFADVFGRSYAFFVTMIFYIIGFIVLATSQNMTNYFGGLVLWAIGNSGLNMLIYLILSDFLSARTRAFGLGIISTPTFITFAVGPKVAGALFKTDSDGSYPIWRWAPGFFCIVVPVVMFPTSVILYWHEHVAKKCNAIPEHPYKRLGIFRGTLQFFIDVDAIGILWVATGWLFLLLALGLGPTQSDGWKTDWVIALLVVGGVVILTLPLCEWFISPRPFIRRQWLNSDVVLSMLLGFFDHMAFQITFMPLFYWVPMNLNINDQSTINYFNYTQMLCLTFAGIITGLVVVFLRRFKWILVSGSCVRLLGTGLMMHYRTSGTTTAQAVWPQILQGLGGGMQGVLLETASQIAVRHQDVSMVLAAVLMIFELGGAIGLAIYSAIMNDQFSTKLQKYLPADEAIKYSYLMWKSATGKVREGIINAFNDSVILTLDVAISFVCCTIVCALFIRDWHLPKSHNVVSDEMPEKSYLKKTPMIVEEETHVPAQSENGEGKFEETSMTSEAVPRNSAAANADQATGDGATSGTKTAGFEVSPPSYSSATRVF